MRRFAPFQKSIFTRTLYLLAVLVFTCAVFFSTTPRSTSNSARTQPSARSENEKKPKDDKCRKRCSPPGDQLIYIPLVDLPEARGGEIVFNSRSAEAMDVTPIFYKRNGQAVIADPVRIESAEIRYVNIEDLVPKQHRHDKDWGGFALSYHGGNRQMWSQFRFLGVNGGGNVDEFFTVKAESRSPLFEAAWWVPDESESIIALGNISDSATSAIVTFSNGHSRTVALQAHATEIVRHQHRSSGTESVRVEVTGPAGSIVPTGIIAAKDGSFNSVIRFYSPGLTRQPHLFANGLRVAGVNSHMVLKNTSASAIVVQPEFLPTSGRANANTLLLPPIDLPPNALTEVDLSPLTAAATFGGGLETVSVQVANNGPPGSVIGSIFGIDETTGLSYDVPLRDSGGPRTMTGSYPWKITDDFSTIVHVTNITDQEAQFITQINYPGGNLIFEPRKVGPGETAVFDFRKIRDEGWNDLAGKQLPANVSQGQFKWAVRGMTNGKLVLIGRAEMVSRSRGISTSYSCNDPCPPYYEGSIDPFPPPIVINGSGTTAIWETAYYDTGYNYYTVGPYATNAEWTPLYNPNVVTVDPSQGHSITVTGMEGGGTTLHGFIAMQQDYGWDGLNCYEYGYYEEYADAPVEVEPPRVGKIQYQGSSGYVDVSGTLYVLKGTSVTFKAVPDPANGQWPAGKPVWSGTSGASGTGETTSVTFNTNSSSATDFKTVVATSGNAITANVIVFELTPTLTPSDNFSGRSTTDFGVTEQITLGFSINPTGLSASQIGGIRWQQNSGSGDLSNALDNGTGSYTVDDSPGTAVLQLKILNGPSKDQGPTKNISVVAPSGGYMTGSDTWHVQFHWSVGFCGTIYILPANVSFLNLQFKEDEVGATATGWLSFLDGVGHSPGGNSPISSGNINTGSAVYYADQVRTGAFGGPGTNYANGNVSWAIPWRYSTGGSYHHFATATQAADSNSTGRARISKAGSGVFSKEANDFSSGGPCN